MKTLIRALRSGDTFTVHATGSRYYGRGGHVISPERGGYSVALFGERRGTPPLHFEASELEADVYDAAEMLQQHALIAGIPSQGKAASHGRSAHLTNPAPAVPIEVNR